MVRGALFTGAVAALLFTSMSSVEANLATGTPPTLYDYDYNGVTTYCYWIKQNMEVSSVDYSYVKVEGKGKECPLLITVKQTTTDTVYAGGEVEFQMTATLNFNDNSFGMTQLEATVLDPVSHVPVQIGHANMHACSHATVCDVFRDGSNRRISAQETSNFTAQGTALFTQKVSYQRAGEYTVFAHMILPPKNAENDSYHFITFMTTTITALAATTADTTTTTGMATGTMIALILGGVIVVIALVVGVIFYKRKPTEMTPGNEHFRHSGYTPSHQTTAKQSNSKKGSRLDWNGDPEFQFGHDRYQASMGSEYKQPPGLNASALMFQDPRSSSRQTKQKTVSSSGSSRGGGSPRGYRESNNQQYRSGGGSRSSGYPSSQRSDMGGGAVQLPAHHGMDTYDTYYNQDSGYDQHQYPSSRSDGMQSFTTEGSLGTAHNAPHYGYNDDHTNGSRRGAPGGSGGGGGGLYDAAPRMPPPRNNNPYSREPDLASLDEYEYEDRDRADTGETLRPVSEVSGRRDSITSMGTVDFALPPSVLLPPKSNFPPPPPPPFRPTGDSFRTEDVPNLADTQLTFNDAEVSKQTIEYIDSLRSQQTYRPSDQASDYVSDFGETSRTFDYRDSTQSSVGSYMDSYRNTDHQFTDTDYRVGGPKKRTPSTADSESYEF